MSAVAQPQSIQVTAIGLGMSFTGHQGITHLQAGGIIWTSQQVVTEIDDVHRYSFYTSVGGSSAWVGVWTDFLGHKYLRTYANGIWNDNLEALPRF